MKKRILALLMAMVMVFGLNTSVLAAPSSVVDNEKEVLDMQVSWDDTMQRTVRMENLLKDGAVYAWYNVTLYQDGKFEASYSAYHDIKFGDGEEEAFYFDFSDRIDEAGDYYVEVSARVYDANGNVISYYEGSTDVKTCIIPDKALPIPANLKISEDGIVTFDLVEGAGHYELELMYYGLWDGDYGKYWTTFEITPEAGATQGTFDLLAWLNEVGQDYDENYTVIVRACSTDLDVMKNSDWSEISNKYEFKISAEKAEEKLEEALKSENPRDVVNAVAGTSPETLNEVLKNDKEMLKKLADKEAAWIKELTERGIEIPETVAPKCDVEGMDESKISVVGAILSAYYTGEVEKVELSVKASTEEVTIGEEYSNAVKLDIELLFDGKAPESLYSPVIITMPIPAGVAAENLVILHYHEEGKAPEKIIPALNADGTMTFAVEGFSTFVVANEVPEEPQGPQGGDDDTTNNDGTTGDGTTNNGGAVGDDTTNNGGTAGDGTTNNGGAADDGTTNNGGAADDGTTNNGGAADDNTTNNGGTDNGEESGGTGDNTPVEALAVIMILSAVVAVIALKKKSATK